MTDVDEVRIGYDGIVVASDINGPAFNFTPPQWYNAIAEFKGVKPSRETVASGKYKISRPCSCM